MAAGPRGCSQVLVALIRGEPVGWMSRFPPFQAPPGYGHSLPTIYLFWAITVGLLYYPSLWYSGWRRRRMAGPRNAAK